MPPNVPRFNATDLRRFFTAVDANLSCPASMIVIGGSAVALYGVSSGTMDIDALGTHLPTPLEDAIARAREVTSLDIPVVPNTVAQVPWDYEDRLQRETDWERLTVLKLEPHDLALSKANRGVESDFAAIEALHRIIPLDLDTLVTRYLEEMNHAIGDETQRDVKFTLMIERVFGEAEAERVDKMLASRRPRAT